MGNPEILHNHLTSFGVYSHSGPLGPTRVGRVHPYSSVYVRSPTHLWIRPDGLRLQGRLLFVGKDNIGPWEEIDGLSYFGNAQSFFRCANNGRKSICNFHSRNVSLKKIRSSLKKFLAHDKSSIMYGRETISCTSTRKRPQSVWNGIRIPTNNSNGFGDYT